MAKRHTGIVLRANSAYRKMVTLFDHHLGKIEGIIDPRSGVSHGMLVSYCPVKSGSRYFLRDLRLQEMPLTWASENLLFFHHVLELSDHFLPWNVHCEGLFRLLYFIYTDSDMVATKSAQKLFLYSFFKRIGIHPEKDDTPSESIKAWVHNHPEMLSLRTAHYLKTLEGYDEHA